MKFCAQLKTDEKFFQQLHLEEIFANFTFFVFERGPQQIGSLCTEFIFAIKDVNLHTRDARRSPSGLLALRLTSTCLWKNCMCVWSCILCQEISGEELPRNC